MYGISTRIVVTHAYIFPSARSTAPRRRGFSARGMLPYHWRPAPVRGFGGTLTPENYRRRDAQPVSYYALFNWVAASKQTSWLSVRPDLL